MIITEQSQIEHLIETGLGSRPAFRDRLFQLTADLIAGNVEMSSLDALGYLVTNTASGTRIDSSNPKYLKLITGANYFSLINQVYSISKGKFTVVGAVNENTLTPMEAGVILNPHNEPASWTVVRDNLPAVVEEGYYADRIKLDYFAGEAPELTTRYYELNLAHPLNQQH